MYANHKMKKIFTTSLMLILFTLALAQDGKLATQADINFHNKVKETFQRALPSNFREWDFSIPESNRALLEAGNYISFCEGTSCFRSEEMEAIYDGSQVKTDEYFALQKEAQSLNSSTPDYGKNLAVILNKFENRTKLKISFCANCSFVSPLTYCKSGGYEKAMPPTGWSAYYASTGAALCDPTNKESTVDVSIFSMGVVPTLKENKEAMPVEGTLKFALNKTTMKTYKIQNVVLKIEGAKENALELVKCIDSSLLKTLLK